MVDICIFKYNLQERKETIVIIEWVLRNIYSNILTPPPLTITLSHKVSALPIPVIP